jgi:hypothetical protein
VPFDIGITKTHSATLLTKDSLKKAGLWKEVVNNLPYQD